ncbi:Putative sodium-coupled neutral amino acid transporter 7 [Sarcoptes scabiei]|nr:Putative sodium-coupled neutral amino acid transporter 7 [Sarcoptes scabiei]
MDTVQRLQREDEEDLGSSVASSARSNFLVESLRQSIDMPAYMQWQTLSTDVSNKLSNLVEWASSDEKNEKSPLIDRDDFDEENSISYADINCNETHRKSSNSSSWPVGVFLLVNTALGAGILNYPAAYDRLGGIFISSILQLLMVFLLTTTMLILILCAELHQDTTYHDVLRSMGGKRAQQLAAISIMCTCFGINVTFLIIIGDQFDRIFHTFIGPTFCHTFWYSRTFTIIATVLISIWPISYFKRLDFLRYLCMLGIFSMLYVVFLNIYEYYHLDVKPGNIKTEPSSLMAAFASLPVICFAYQTHEIVLPVYSCLSRPRAKNFIKSTFFSLVILIIIYMLGGTYGYLTFGDNVRADIIQMYDARDPVVATGIIALIIKMISTYVPIMFCGRGALDGLYAEWMRLTTEQYIKGERCRRIIATTFWNLLVLILAIVTPNITIAIETLGSLAACNVFVFPGICMISLASRHLNGYYYKIQNERRLLKELEGTRKWSIIWYLLRSYGLFIILFGCGMFILVCIQVGIDITSTIEEILEKRRHFNQLESHTNVTGLLQTESICL